MDTLTTQIVESEDVLIRRYDDYVQALARRLYRRVNRSIELDELVSLGRIGLLQAVRRYEPDRGCSLKTFAHQRIKGAMLDGLRQESRQVRLKNLVRGVEANLRPAFGTACVDGVAELEGAVDTVITGHLLGFAMPGTGHSVEMMENPESALARREEHAILHECLDGLEPRHAEIIRGYYFDGKTLADLGLERGRSRARMCRLLAEACRKLGQAVRDAGVSREAVTPLGGEE